LRLNRRHAVTDRAGGRPDSRVRSAARFFCPALVRARLAEELLTLEIGALRRVEFLEEEKRVGLRHRLAPVDLAADLGADLPLQARAVRRIGMAQQLLEHLELEGTV